MPHSRATTPKHTQVTQPILYSAAEYYAKAARDNGSAVTDVHDFFAQICDELTGQAEVVIVGNSESVGNFHNFVQIHASRLAAIISYEIAADLDNGQFAVFTRDTSSDN
ncbi:hypothetical protein [Asticcacaulis sp. AC460]|uniref:hypothetical protein n=1 Tax=Asticcacaulis sp. AC460 TaxID=1282360 RepID=UPI0012DC28DC|nr:hypothetical protein [Asticcacaulis sp. AC460]